MYVCVCEWGQMKDRREREREELRDYLHVCVLTLTLSTTLPPPPLFPSFQICNHAAAWPWGLTSQQICDKHSSSSSSPPPLLHCFCPVTILPSSTPCSLLLCPITGRGGGTGVTICLFCGVLLCHSPLMICHNFQTLCFKDTFICFAIFDLLLFC